MLRVLVAVFLPAVAAFLATTLLMAGTHAASSIGSGTRPARAAASAHARQAVVAPGLQGAARNAIRSVAPSSEDDDEMLPRRAPLDPEEARVVAAGTRADLDAMARLLRSGRCVCHKARLLTRIESLGAEASPLAVPLLAELSRVARRNARRAPPDGDPRCPCSSLSYTTDRLVHAIHALGSAAAGPTVSRVLALDPAIDADARVRERMLDVLESLAGDADAAWRVLLDAEDPALRRKATIWVGHHNVLGRDGDAAIARRLDDAHAEVRRVAVLAIAHRRRGPIHAVGALLGDSDELVREAAVRALGAIGHDPKRRARLLAAHLARTPGPMEGAALLEACAGLPASLRPPVVSLLTLSLDAESMAVPALAPLARVVRDDPDGLARGFAGLTPRGKHRALEAWLLAGKTSPAIQACVREAPREGRGETLVAAMAALGGDATSLSVLAEALASRGEDARIWPAAIAARALGARAKALLPALLAADVRCRWRWDDDCRDVSEHARLCSSLARDAIASVGVHDLDTVIRSVHASTHPARSAWRAFQRAGARGVVRLREALAGGDARERECARAWLAEIGRCRHTPPDVREAARRALASATARDA